ncbi:MAG: hypothetical protein QOE82_2749 [Thermoanaerobaculia bacterium]|jgi:hypothetical protein|nr:hypothetical protein [Thermoanaerobaculia bacterium]
MKTWLRGTVTALLGLIAAFGLYWFAVQMVAQAVYRNSTPRTQIPRAGIPKTDTSAASMAEAERRAATLEPRLANMEGSWTFLQSFISVVTIVLTVVTIFIAVASLYGIGALRTYIEEIVKSRTEQEYKELSARLYAAQGTVFGEVSLNDDTQEVDRAILLDNAITYLQIAARNLPATNAQAYGAVRNNLAFFYAVRARKDTKHLGADAEEAIEIIKELRASSVMKRNPSTIDTRARVVSAFYKHFPNDRDELEHALREISVVLQRDDTSPKQKTHARITVDRLIEAANKIDPTFGNKLKAEAEKI